MFSLRKGARRLTGTPRAVARASCMAVLSRGWNALACAIRVEGGALEGDELFIICAIRGPENVSATVLECILWLLFLECGPGERWDGVMSTTWMEAAQPSSDCHAVALERTCKSPPRGCVWNLARPWHTLLCPPSSCKREIEMRETSRSLPLFPSLVISPLWGVSSE